MSWGCGTILKGFWRILELVSPLAMTGCLLYEYKKTLEVLNGLDHIAGKKWC